MRKAIIFPVVIIILCVISGCKKDQPVPPIPNTSGYFFKNTIWTGTYHSVSQQYNGPCSLTFLGDTGISVHALFNYVENLETFHILHLDSILGKINYIDSATYEGVIVLDVTFPLTGQQDQLYISDKNEITSASTGTALPYNYYSYNVRLCPSIIPSLAGTVWSGAIQPGTEQNPIYDYPDVSPIIFGVSTTQYMRNGVLVHYSYPQIDQIYEIAYYQIGPRVYFYGYNETLSVVYKYFGIYCGGTTMLIDARNPSEIDQAISGRPRLPTYLDTQYTYGPPGVTPSISKL